MENSRTQYQTTQQPGLMPLELAPERAAKKAEPGRSAEKAILAALRSTNQLLNELSARYEVPKQNPRPADRPAVHSPEDACRIAGPEMENLAQEQLRVLLLDIRNQVIGQSMIYQGNVKSAAVRPAEVFRPAVIENAPAIIVLHNHPSGDPEPSAADNEMTRTLRQAGELLSIELLDHIITGSEGRFVSLKERKVI